jgi:hypothetical protein
VSTTGIGGGLDTVGLFCAWPGRAGQFFNGFPLGGQGRHHGTHLGIGGLAVKNFRHHLRHLGFAQIGSADNGCQVILEHGWRVSFLFLTEPLFFIKLRSNRLPNGVMMDSG